MSKDPRLERILERVLELHVTPEEACRDAPELLPEVRRCLVRFRALSAEIDAVFPASPASPEPAAEPDDPEE